MLRSVSEVFCRKDEIFHFYNEPVSLTLIGCSYAKVLDSKYNRSINAVDTEMVVVGPAAGAEGMKTKADPTGTVVYGTFGNCGNGYTPWNTYLTCEENVTDYD